MKPAAPAVMATGLYAGTTLADDGSPILLFDPAGIAQVGGVKLEDATSARRGLPTHLLSVIGGRDAGPAFPRPRRSASRHAPGGRRSDRGSARRTAIRPGAGQLRVQLGETILPLAGVNGDLPGEKVRLFRLNDGHARSATPSAKSSTFPLSATRSSPRLRRVRSPAWLWSPGSRPRSSTRTGSSPISLRAGREPGGAARLPSACRTIPGCRTCFARSSRRQAIASCRTRDEAEADLAILSEASAHRWRRRPATIRFALGTGSGIGKGRDHLSLRPRRAADGAQVGGRREALMSELLADRHHCRRACRASRRMPSNPSSSWTRLIPVPRAAPHVAGLSALRSRVLTVIDCMRSLELGVTDCSDGIREAAVVELDGHHYALIVDLVEDVVEALSEPADGSRGDGARLGARFQGHGRDGAGPLLLIDIAALVGGRRSEGCLSSSLPLAA